VGNENCVQSLFKQLEGKLKGRDDLEKLHVLGRIILERMLEKEIENIQLVQDVVAEVFMSMMLNFWEQ
jgi:hypothetical protein